MSTAGRDAARAARDKLMGNLEDLPELRGIGITRQGEGYAVKVNLSSLPPQCTIPEVVDDVPVVLEIVGDIRPQEL